MSTHTHSSPSFAINGRWIFALVLIALFIGFVKLGFQQLDCANQKQSLRETRTERMKAEAVDIRSIVLQPVGSQWYSSADKQLELKSHLQWLKVSMQGQYLYQRSLLISGQLFRGQPGFEVITPFKLEASDAVVLVSRGWIPAEIEDKQLQQFIVPEEADPSQQTLTVNGLIHVPVISESSVSPSPVSDSDARRSPPTFNQLDLNVLAKRFDAPMFAYVVRLSDKQQGLLQRHWRDPEVTPGSHRSYAIQWFVFALLVLIVLVSTQMDTISLMRTRRSSADDR